MSHHMTRRNRYLGTWCSAITSASHAEVPGFSSQCVHAIVTHHTMSGQLPYHDMPEHGIALYSM